MPSDRHQAAQRGQTVVIVALGMVAFLGFLGLALDGAGAYLEQQNLQRAADLAALSATWGYYHASYQEQDGYGVVFAGMTAANRAASTTLGANGYAAATRQVAFVDVSGSDVNTIDCGPGGPTGPNCPQPWVVRGVRVHLSKLLAPQVLQAIGIGSATITADAKGEVGPNTGARHEAPLLLRNFNAGRNLSRAGAYTPGPCSSNPVDGFRYPMSTDCRPSTRRAWSTGQPMSLEPAWSSGSPEVFPFNQPDAPITTFFLLHEKATDQPPANSAKEPAVELGLDEFLPTCASLCANPTTVYADTIAPAPDPVVSGMMARIGKATALGSRWVNQSCASPHSVANPLTPDNPRLVRLPVTYATSTGGAGADGVGAFLVSETVVLCVDSVPVSGVAYAVSGYLVEEPTSDTTVLRAGDPYFGRDVVVKLRS